MSPLLNIIVVVLVILLAIAFLTASWKTMHDFLVKIIKWLVKAIYGAIGLALFLWLCWTFCKH